VEEGLAPEGLLPFAPRVSPVPITTSLWNHLAVITSRRVMRRGFALAVTAFAFVTAGVGATQGAPTRFLILDTTLGLVFVVAGLVAWERRPEVSTGPLLVLAGALWWVGSYAPAGLVPFSTLGFAFERYYDLILAFLVLTFAGAPFSRSGRIVLGVMAAAFVIRTASRIFIGCQACMPNPFAMIQDQELFDGIQVVTSGLIAAAAIGVAVLAVARLRRATPATRRILNPVVAAGVVAALVACWDALDLIVFIATGEGVVRLTEQWNEIVSWTIIGAVVLIPLGLLFGVLRLRAGHGRLARLALELDRGLDPRHLERSLRHALGDPSLELLVWNREPPSWLDAAGRAVAEPVEGSRAVTTLERDGEPIAAVIHDRALREDPGLVAAATTVLRLAIENERLAADVRTQLAEVRASRARLVAAAEEERQRIERDLHDGAQQRLVGLALSLQEARDEARQHSPDAPFVHRLDDLADDLLGAIDELRELARGIHPAVLTEDGLGVAVTSLARRATVPVTVDLAVDGRLPGSVEAASFYVVAEALTNVTRHARARSATIRIVQHDGRLELEICDDGIGGADAERGSGLRGLADRLDAISGSLDVESPPGCGTRLRAVIPCG
jgi:signal transduction histidine kinase